MARLTTKERENIKNALILGDSQYSVANEFEVSTATVNKIFKSISKDDFLVKEVKEEIAIKSKLSNESESLVKAFGTKVNTELRRKNLVYGVSENIIKKAGEMLEVVDSPADLKSLSDTVDKTSITLGVNARHAINQVNVQNNQNIEPTKIIREIVDVSPTL